MDRMKTPIVDQSLESLSQTWQNERFLLFAKRKNFRQNLQRKKKENLTIVNRSLFD